MPGPAWLILPTYDEAENITPVVEAALAELERAAPGAHRILIADNLAARHAAVEVLHRARRQGLGPAYLAGFDRALEEGAGYVMEMDADFSHDPADLGRLLDAARAGAGLVL